MKNDEFEFIELVTNRPGMFGIRDSMSYYSFFNGARTILAIHGYENSPIINCFFKFQNYCEKIFNLYRKSSLSGMDLVKIYCDFYKIDEYKFTKFLMAQFLKNNYKYDVTYEYEVFEINDVKKPFEN